MDDYKRVGTGIAILGTLGGVMIGFSIGFILGVYL